MTLSREKAWDEKRGPLQNSIIEGKRTMMKPMPRIWGDQILNRRMEQYKGTCGGCVQKYKVNRLAP